tara:strand:+ start:43 stop:324 length:282 start_codon:yes stop_codon:yes gene_type:complete
MRERREDPNCAGTFDHNKNWKKLREKHRKRKAQKARGITPNCDPEVYQASPNVIDLEGQARNISKKLYDLNYELAFSRITQAEYDKLREELGE